MGDDDEHVLATVAVDRVGMSAAEEHLVLDGDRVQVARAHADEGIARGGLGPLDDLEVDRTAVAPGLLGPPEA